MSLQKITGPDGTEMTAFVVVDLDGATAADGVVRCAKKVLVDGARTMARSRTYAWALLGEQISGASAGISVPPERADDGIAAFVDSVQEQVASGELSLDAAKGVRADQLTTLLEADRRGALHLSARAHGTLDDELLARGVLAAAAAVLGDLQGRTVAIEGAGTAGPALLALAAEAGATVVAISTLQGSVVEPDGIDATQVAGEWAQHGDGLPAALGSDVAPSAALSTTADVLVCGSKLGVIDHEVAASLEAQLVVPIGPAPVTAKGLAVAASRDITVLPDFLTTSGPLHAWRTDGDTAATDTDADAIIDAATSFVTETTIAVLEHDEGPYLGACYRAEEFLSTWQERLPFGRPLA